MLLIAHFPSQCKPVKVLTFIATEQVILGFKSDICSGIRDRLFNICMICGELTYLNSPVTDIHHASLFSKYQT